MIDTILFAKTFDAGTYTSGEKYALDVVRGPSVVRDGYGQAVLKEVTVLGDYGNVSNGSYVEFKNANWNDSLKTMVSSGYGNVLALADVSPAIQKCGNTGLQPNSAFEVSMVIGETVTTTDPFTVYVLVDIDYPSVQAIANPRDESGLPVSIIRNDTITTTARATADTLTWTTLNVDEFKAGYRYLLAQIGLFVSSTTAIGFVAFSGAPSMNGLVRIIPVLPRYAHNCRKKLEYSTPLVKGPMNIEYAVVDASAASATAVLECDYIRR